MNTPQRVLVVEDDILIATHIADTIAESGYAAELVCTVADAESALAAANYDAVILDFRVGNDPSLEFARELATTNVPFFFCTGSIEEEVHEFLREAVVVTKPFRDEVLTATLTRVIAAATPPAA